MKTIRDLLSLRGSDRSALCIQTAPIARNCCDLRMLSKPICHGLRTAVRQEFDHTMKFQIDEYRSIGLKFPPRPVIHAYVLNRLDVGCRSLFQPAQHCVVACGYRQSGEKSLTRKTAGDITDDTDDF